MFVKKKTLKTFFKFNLKLFSFLKKPLIVKLFFLKKKFDNFISIRLNFF